MTAWVASEPLLLINFILCGALMRRGKEFYSQNYKKALDLHERGITIKDIAKTLGLSYSAVYSWVSKSRRPGKGALIKFKEVLRSRGPMPAALIKKEINKHNDFYHIARQRGFGIKRRVIKGLKLGEYAYWYYLPGQEQLLEERISELLNDYKQAKEKLLSVLKKMKL